MVINKTYPFKIHITEACRVLCHVHSSVLSKFIQQSVSLIAKRHSRLNATRLYFLNFEIQFINAVSNLIDTINVIFNLLVNVGLITLEIRIDRLTSGYQQFRFLQNKVLIGGDCRLRGKFLKRLPEVVHALLELFSIQLLHQVFHISCDLILRGVEFLSAGFLTVSLVEKDISCMCNIADRHAQS